jgi:hypothetical protein
LSSSTAPNLGQQQPEAVGHGAPCGGSMKAKSALQARFIRNQWLARELRKISGSVKR